MKKLFELGVNECAEICAINDIDRNIGSRLRDIGFSEGCEVRCVGRSPLGDPSAFSVRGAVIALRREDSACIDVETVYMKSTERVKAGIAKSDTAASAHSVAGQIV